jgi:exonuclease III
MLNPFIRIHNFDVLLLQEVAHPFPIVINGYQVFYNIGTNRRGTAILSRDTIPLTNISKLPTGRAIATSLATLLIINVYAPSSTSKRAEREPFYNNELPYILRTASGKIILGGDFNCVLEAKDATGHANYSRSLTILTQSYALSEAWQTHHNRKVYTRYTAQNAAGLDRFYPTQNLMNRKQKTETLPAAFNDNLAVSLQISVTTTIARGRALWKLNPETLQQ